MMLARPFAPELAASAGGIAAGAVANYLVNNHPAFAREAIAVDALAAAELRVKPSAASRP